MSYENELEELVKIHYKNRDIIINKYKNYTTNGLDGAPDTKELKQENRDFWKKVKELKQQHNIS